jgi:hypothetical protein
MIYGGLGDDAAQTPITSKKLDGLSAATQNDAPGVLVRRSRTKTPESSK